MRRKTKGPSASGVRIDRMDARVLLQDGPSVHEAQKQIDEKEHAGRRSGLPLRIHELVDPPFIPHVNKTASAPSDTGPVKSPYDFRRMMGSSGREERKDWFRYHKEKGKEEERRDREG